MKGFKGFSPGMICRGKQYGEGMKGFKGFSPGMICRGKQYAENTEYEEEEAKICETGMHFCESPLDVFRFYPPTDEQGNLNEFAEVEAEDAKTDDGIKFVTKKLKIGAKLSLSEFVNAGVEFLLEKQEGKPATNTGNCSAASVEGKESIAIVTGRNSKAKGALNDWLVLTERDDDWKILGVKAVMVDGEKIKADTWYCLTGGEVKEAAD